MRRFLSCLLILSLAFIFIGCTKKPAAVVNGAEISNSALQWALNQRISEHEASGAVVSDRTLRNLVLDQMVSDKLLYLGAQEKNITVDDEAVKAEVSRIMERMGKNKFENSLSKAHLKIEDFTQLVRERLVVDKFAQSLVSEDDIKEDAVKDYYKTSPTPFLVPETVNVRFIQTPTKERAEAIVKELKEGKNFDKVADSLQNETGITVSSYSWAQPSYFSAGIADALKSIKVGSYDGPVKSGSGFFIFRVKERQHERAKTFDEAKDEIKKLLLDQRRQAVVAHWVEERRKKADIVINE